MKTTSKTQPRSRSEIIASIAALPAAVQGKICKMTKTLADGKTATYYNLQYWHDGKNHTTHIPKGRLGDFQKAVEGGHELQRLADELSRADAAAILSSADSLKKNLRKSRSGARPKSAR